MNYKNSTRHVHDTFVFQTCLKITYVSFIPEPVETTTTKWKRIQNKYLYKNNKSSIKIYAISIDINNNKIKCSVGEG